MATGVNAQITMICRLEVITMEKKEENLAKRPANPSW